MRPPIRPIAMFLSFLCDLVYKLVLAVVDLIAPAVKKPAAHFYNVVKTSSVAYAAKAWMHDMLARFHIVRTTFA